MLLWNTDIDALDLDSHWHELSALRQQQVCRYKYDRGRKLCAGAFLLLRQGLKCEYGITDIPAIGYQKHGKPYLLDYPYIHFSWSHSGNAVVCAIDTQPIGIDMEDMTAHNRRKLDSLIEYTMNESEQQLIASQENRLIAFLQLWTQKEAVVKLTGEGITNNMQDILTRNTARLTTDIKDNRYIFSSAKGESFEFKGIK